MRVDCQNLTELTVTLLERLGASHEEAPIVAQNLVAADMRGTHTHGVNLLRNIAERTAGDILSLPTTIRVVRDEGATAVLDGGNGLGQSVAYRAMHMNLRKAKELGVGITLVRNTNNIGHLAFYSMIAAGKGMVGVVMANAAAALAPWGGAEAFFGTNPISIAVPAGDGGSIVLDMSSSVVARGKVRRASRLKESIPYGWAIDKDGAPTTDPVAALSGTILPMGGPKGYGLALMVDVLSGVLSGSKFGPEIKTFHKMLGPTGAGVFTLAIDIARFMPVEQFASIMKAYVASIKCVRKAEGVKCIFMPGEIEENEAKRSREEGVQLDPDVLQLLRDLANSKGVPFSLEVRN